MNTTEHSKMHYNYAFKHFLIEDLDVIPNVTQCQQIMLCVYKINTHGKYPFIQYLLSNNGFDLMSLPVLPIFSTFNKDSLISYSKVFLSGILNVDNFEEFNKTIVFDGFYDYNNNLNLFFDTTKCNLHIDETYSSTSVRFALMDEILNHCSLCNIKIKEETTRFFINNASINYLHDEHNKVYDTPIVGFVGKTTPSKVNFTYIFGESAKNKSAILGPYFYFTDFNYAIRQGGWSHDYKPEYMHDKLITDNEHGRYVKGGIIRFALFTGNTKYIENMPNDPVDESQIKKQRLNDPNLNRTYEMLTLRISDHDGLWSNTFDSVYLGNIELDDDIFLKEKPIIVVKDYNQQVPLSSHYIDKNKLGETFNPNPNDCSYGIV